VSFGIYILGFLILIGGLIYGAVILHVAAHWIAVGAIVLLGLAILKGVQATRGKDPSYPMSAISPPRVLAPQRSSGVTRGPLSSWETIAALYFAREILIPLAFALTLTFLLTPAVALLPRNTHRPCGVRSYHRPGFDCRSRRHYLGHCQPVG
jgi:hypothetical protein